MAPPTPRVSGASDAKPRSISRRSAASVNAVLTRRSPHWYRTSALIMRASLPGVQATPGVTGVNPASAVGCHPDGALTSPYPA